MLDGFMFNKEESSLMPFASKLGTLPKDQKSDSSILNLEAGRQTIVADVEEEAPAQKKKAPPREGGERISKHQVRLKCLERSKGKGEVNLSL